MQYKHSRLSRLCFQLYLSFPGTWAVVDDCLTFPFLSLTIKLKHKWDLMWPEDQDRAETQQPVRSIDIPSVSITCATCYHIRQQYDSPCSLTYYVGSHDSCKLHLSRQAPKILWHAITNTLTHTSLAQSYSPPTDTDRLDAVGNIQWETLESCQRITTWLDLCRCLSEVRPKSARSWCFQGSFFPLLQWRWKDGSDYFWDLNVKSGPVQQVVSVKLIALHFKDAKKSPR